MREPNSGAGRLGSVEAAPISVHGDITTSHNATTDTDSFADFYRDHCERIGHALLVTLGDHELARDATNEAMARALHRWKSVSRYSNPTGWVYRVGLNWARSWLRRRRREQERPLVVVQSTAAVEPADEELQTAIDALSVDHRAIVVCRFFLDWSVEETANALDIPPGTVKSRLSRALAHIRAHLEVQDDS